MKARQRFRFVSISALIVLTITPLIARAEVLFAENDTAATATVVNSLPYSVTADNTFATDDVTEMCAPQHSLWWSFTPTTDLDLEARSSTSAIQTEIGVYERNADGSLKGLACDRYSERIRFKGVAGQTYLIQVGSYYTLDFGEITMSLAAFGRITGTITDAAGSPIRDCAYLYSGDSTYSSFGTTSGADGRYTISYVAPGSYKLKFGCYNHKTEWYDDKATRDEADTIDVAAGETLEGIDAVLTKKGAISGRVTAGSNPLRSMCVYAYSSSDAQYSVGSTYTDSDGSYRIPIAQAGSYKVFFKDCAFRIYASEWFSDKTGFELADPLDVADGQEVTAIDAELAELPAPSNDNLADATVIASLPFSDTTNMNRATVETGERFCSSSSNRSVWYRFTPDADTLARFSVSTYGQISVFTKLVDGIGHTGLIPAGCARMSSNPKVDVATKAGQTYLIQVIPYYYDFSNLTFHADVTPRVNNDNMADATAINELPKSFDIDTTEATSEPAEATYCGGSASTVWFRYAPTQDQLVVLDPTGPMDTVVSIYRETTGGTTFLDCNSELLGKNSPTALVAEAGETYLLQVSGRRTTGQTKLSLMKPSGSEAYSFEALTACAATCPYWGEPNDPAAELEAACSDSPTSAPGSWSDYQVTVPETVGGNVPTHLVFHLIPGMDYDGFICRASPVDGKYFLSTDANSIDEKCGTATMACEEAAVVRVTPGEVLILRAYNWLDTDAADAHIAYVTG